MICVIATIELAEGCREKFLAEFRRVAPHVRAERGCVEYVPMIDVPTNIAAQSPVRPNAVIVVEKWEDIGSLEAHLIAPHMIEYRKRVKDLVQSVALQVLSPA